MKGWENFRIDCVGRSLRLTLPRSPNAGELVIGDELLAAVRDALGGDYMHGGVEGPKPPTRSPDWQEHGKGPTPDPNLTPREGDRWLDTSAPQGPLFRVYRGGEWVEDDLGFVDPKRLSDSMADAIFRRVCATLADVMRGTGATIWAARLEDVAARCVEKAGR